MDRSPVPRPRRRSTPALVPALAAVLITLPAVAADGDLDPGFFGDGTVTWADGGDTFTLWSAVGAPDGALVVAGRRVEPFNVSSAAHWRRLTDSTLGPACDMTDAAWDFLAAYAVTFDVSGKLLVAGAIHDGGTSQLFVARYLYPACTLDATFGDGGVAMHPIPGITFNRVFGISSFLAAPDPPFLVQRILVIGAGSSGADTPGVMVRLTGSGALDSGWGSGGIAPVPMSGGAVLGASFFSGGAVFVGTRDREFWISRRLANGAADNTFGTLGVVELPIDASPDGVDAARAVAAYPDGRLMVAGDAEVAPSATGGESPLGFSSVGVLARLHSNGSLDTTFGATGPTPGHLLYGFGDPSPYSIRAADVALQGNGRVLFAASAAAPDDRAIFVVRTLPNGNYDTSFGGDGIASVDLDVSGPATDTPTSLLLRGGRPVVVGQADGADFDDPAHAFALRLQSSYVFADGFASGNTAAWSGD